MTAIHILGFGAYTPERRMSNDELARLVDTSDEWIVSRSGIRARHVLADGEQNSDAGTKAALQALEHANISPESITHVLTATCTPDYLCCPSTACIISSNLGIHGEMAFDISAACSGFIYGLDLAKGILSHSPDANILLVATEALTRRINWQDRGTSVLFGDGAGAMILGAGSSTGKAQLIDSKCRADGAQHLLLTVGGGSNHRYEPGDAVQPDFYIQMQGREVFKVAVRSLTAICREILSRNELEVGDIDLFIPHQANLRIIEAVGSRLAMPHDRIFVNVDEHGNTSAASIPLALREAWELGRIQPGMKVLLSTFGGGFTWGAALLQF